jgi:hypothetical protein
MTALSPGWPQSCQPLPQLLQRSYAPPCPATLIFNATRIIFKIGADKSQILKKTCQASTSGKPIYSGVRDQEPRQRVQKTLSGKNLHKKSLVEWLKVKAPSSNTNITKQINK